MAEGETGMTEICVTSSVAEMYVAGLKTSVRSVSVLNTSSVRKGTMTTTAPTTTNLTNSVLPKGGCNAGGVKAFSQDLRRVCWPMNFKPSGIEKYDGSTNPVKWLKVYQFAIEAIGGDSYVMANYLPVCLSSSARSWLLGLPVGSVHSWSHLYQLFTINFCAMCACLGVNWDLASVIQKKGESLWEFI
jgi:hypothetical protein